MNAELRKAGLDPIESAESRYRREPDQVILELRARRKKWIRVDRWTGLEQDVLITGERDGRIMLLDAHGNILAGAREVEVEHVVPEQRRTGRWLEGLVGSVRLPG